MFHLLHSEFMLPGAYRYAAVRPESLEYSLVEYVSPLEPLFASDLELLERSTAAAAASGSAGAVSGACMLRADSQRDAESGGRAAAGGDGDGDGTCGGELPQKQTQTQTQTQTALVLRFSLPASAYATVALRELLREHLRDRPLPAPLAGLSSPAAASAVILDANQSAD